MLTGRRMKEAVSLKQSLLMSYLANHYKAKLDEWEKPVDNFSTNCH